MILYRLNFALIVSALILNIDLSHAQKMDKVDCTDRNFQNNIVEQNSYSSLLPYTSHLEVDEVEIAQNEECYALFWISTSTLSSTQYVGTMVHVSIDGKAIMMDKPNGNKSLPLNQGANKYLTVSLANSPTCNASESCVDIVSQAKVSYCDCSVIKVKLTANKSYLWVGEEVGGEGRKWSRSFTAKPGCNIIGIN